MIFANNLRKNYGTLEVINDTTLKLPKKGMVAFLGESGSGKTTLVNVLGGLDSYKSGSISYDDTKFLKYQMDKVDTYRRNHFGYIFQNYNILEDKTVYENLLLALHIIGIYDETECEKRIKNALEAVGLYKFRKKLAGALSGGQMQRVSIARALVKHNDVIIADEPTGNLDSESTRQIIRILKKLSINSLIILVTHDISLANTYADYIYHIKDGKISDYKELSNSEVLENKGINDVYLGDLKKEEIINDSLRLTIHKETENKLEVEIYEHDGVYYLKSTSPLKLEYQNLKLHEGKYEAKQVKSEDFKYHDDNYLNITSKNVGRLWHSIKEETSLFFKGKLKSKIFKFAFFLIGIIFMIINIMLISNSDDFSAQINADPNVFDLSNDYSADSESFNHDVSDAIDNNYISNISKNENYSDHFMIYMNLSIRTIVYINTECYNVSMIEGKLYNGRMPTNANEVVITTEIADKFIDSTQLNNYEELIGLKVNDYTICGLVKSDKKYIYRMNSYDNLSSTYEIESTSYPMKSVNDNISLRNGRLPKKLTEVLVSYNIFKQYKLNVGDKLESGDYICGVVADGDGCVYALEERCLINNASTSGLQCTVNNSEKLNEYKSIIPVNYYQIRYQNKLDDYNETKYVYFAIEAVLLVICAIYTFFTMKSRMLQDIYEIGVRRELGQKRKSIIGKYALRSFMTITLTMMLGYIISNLIYGYIAVKVNSLGGYLPSVLVSASTYYLILIIYGVGILFGIIPVLGLLRKTPAQIVSKYDI